MAKLLMLFGLLFMACGEVDGTLEPGEPGSGKSSSSGNAISSSSRECIPSIGSDFINWQPAPSSSYVHGTMEVSLDAFYISKYPVTQEQYKTIMENNPSGVKNDMYPVDGVTWFDAVEFTKRLSEQMCLDVKLPTEAQWEYVAFPDPPVIQRYADYWEWTNDCFDSKFPWTSENPSGPPDCLRDYPKVRKGLNHKFDVRFATDPGLNNISGGYITFRVAVKN